MYCVGVVTPLLIKWPLAPVQVLLTLSDERFPRERDSSSSVPSSSSVQAGVDQMFSL